MIKSSKRVFARELNNKMARKQKLRRKKRGSGRVQRMPGLIKIMV